MIPVLLQVEPHSFNAKVRIPGQKFLAKTPNPTHDEFKKNSFWKSAAKEIYEAYSRVCAYTCRYIDVPAGLSITSIVSRRIRSRHTIGATIDSACIG